MHILFSASGANIIAPEVVEVLGQATAVCYGKVPYHHDHV